MSDPSVKPDLKADVGKGPGCLGTTITAMLAVALLAGGVVLSFSLEKIEAWEVGIRFWNYPIPLIAPNSDGPVPEPASNVLQPGYNIIIPFLHSLVKYDASIQQYDMAFKYSGLPEPDGPPVKVRPARDQEEVDVFVTVLYHVNVNKADALRRHYSSSADVRKKGLGIIARQRIQERLGRMMTAPQFFEMTAKKRAEIIARRKTDPNYLIGTYPNEDYLLDRTTQANQALNDMNMYFEPQGIEIVDILIWDFKFKDELEASIIANVIGSAKAEMEQSLQEAENQRSNWQRQLAEAYAAQEAELARGRAESMKIDAQAQQYLDMKTSAGDRLVLEAQAEGKGRINQALAGRGGQVYAGLQYAEALKGVELIVLPSGADGFNPLDAGSAVRNMIPGGGQGGTP